MVSKKKALIASGVSALIVGAVHFTAHMVYNNVMFVGTVVVLTVFGVAYFGMRR